MGWVESPPNFCAASKTARDVAVQYTKTPIGSLPDNMFINYAMGSNEAENEFRYLVEVYVDDFMALAIALSHEQVRHVASALLTGIHDVFPADAVDENDPVSLKKLSSSKDSLH
jgi:hypothetical protein